MKELSPEERWREQIWRGSAKGQEQAGLAQWLRAHPEQAEKLEEELALTKALRRLPGAEVPGNFTARVMAEVERERAKTLVRDEKPSLWTLATRRWLPRFALGLVLAVTTFGGIHFVKENQRAELARSVSVVSEMAAAPGTEVWRDYEAIRVLHEPAADVELLSLLQ